MPHRNTHVTSLYRLTNQRTLETVDQIDVPILLEIPESFSQPGDDLSVEYITLIRHVQPMYQVVRMYDGFLIIESGLAPYRLYFEKVES